MNHVTRLLDEREAQGLPRRISDRASIVRMAEFLRMPAHTNAPEIDAVGAAHGGRRDDDGRDPRAGDLAAPGRVTSGPGVDDRLAGAQVAEDFAAPLSRKVGLKPGDAVTDRRVGGQEVAA